MKFNVHSLCWYITPTIRIVVGDHGFWIVSIMFLCFTFGFEHRHISINIKVDTTEAERSIEKLIKANDELINKIRPK